MSQTTLMKVSCKDQGRGRVFRLLIQFNSNSVTNTDSINLNSASESQHTIQQVKARYQIHTLNAVTQKHHACTFPNALGVSSGHKTHSIKGLQHHPRSAIIYLVFILCFFSPHCISGFKENQKMVFKKKKANFKTTVTMLRNPISKSIWD